MNAKTFGSEVYILSSFVKFFLHLPEVLDFKPSLQTGSTALTSELKQTFLMDWKQDSAFMTCQPTTLSKSFKYGVLFGAEGKDVLRSGSGRFCSSQRLKISFSLVIWCSPEYSFLCFSLSTWGLIAIWGRCFILAFCTTSVLQMKTLDILLISMHNFFFLKNPLIQYMFSSFSLQPWKQ